MNTTKTGTGLIITEVGPVGVLNRYKAELSGRDLVADHTCADKASATEHFIVLFNVELGKIGESVAWVAGDGVHRPTARKLGIPVRKRAPGGGRKRKDPADRVVPLNTWVTPAQRLCIETAANASGRSLGEEIASRFA